jgi:hypothetical protein
MARAVTTRNQNDRSYLASVNVDPGLPSLNQVCAKLLRSFGDKSSFGELLVVILDALAVVGALGLRPRGALLFADGNGSLITVACRGIDTAALLKGFGNAPSISAAGIFLYQGLVILPLQDGEAHLGMVALGLDSGEQLDPSALALLGGLAPILSLVVCRRILESVVDFRDFEIQFAQTETLHQLAIAEQLRDLDTGLHVLRVAHYCKAIAEAAGLDDKTVSLILQAAPMHDVGKICIPDAILLSPRRLTEAEFNQVKRHTLFGEQILNGQGEVISAARIIAGSHHERWDGTGVDGCLNPRKDGAIAWAR